MKKAVGGFVTSILELIVGAVYALVMCALAIGAVVVVFKVIDWLILS